MNLTSRRSGFTLVEKLVVVAVIVGCGVLAFPNIHFAKININQKHAVSMLATLSAANSFYARDHKSYPDRLDRMMGGDYVEDERVLRSGVNQPAYHGYHYIYHVDDKNSRFLIFAVPEKYKKTGRQTFVVSIKGVVYEADIEDVSEAPVKQTHILFNFMNSSKPLWNIEDGAYLQLAETPTKWVKTLVEEK